MAASILNYCLKETITIDSILHWLKSGDEPLLISKDTLISPQQFAQLFLTELRSETQWLLKVDNVASNQLDSSNENSTNISVTAPTQKEQILDTTSSSVDNNLSVKRIRPRVKLFSSPLPHNSPKSSTPLSSNTPNRSANSTDSFDSPAWPNLSSPGLFPSKAKVETPQKGLKSYNEDFRNKSRAKLSLGDFLIKDAPASKGKNRRIKPTKILETNSTPISAFHATEENTSFTEDRQALKMDCEAVENRLNSITPIKVLKRPTDPSTPDSPREETPSKLSFTPKPSLPPPSFDICNVTNKESLLKLTKIFSFLLIENLCENLMTELCFIVNLLVAQVTTNNDRPPFDSLHNCAFFAVTSLAQLIDIIIHLSPTTLCLIATSPAVPAFDPSLGRLLEQQSQEKLKTFKPNLDVCQGGNVSFQSDTDNVANFTSHFNFTSFRKQRDGLYHLLQIWEKERHSTGWSFESRLSSRVRNILAIRDDPTNIMHLARLFRSQLLASCSIFSPTMEGSDDMLGLLPTADRARIMRLEARLSGQGGRRGPVPAPDFPGRQQFFKDFIKACGPGPFLHFLQICFVDELLRLNETEFIFEANDTFVDELTEKRYIECLSSTRLLAKFLAYCEYLPYEGSDNFSEQVVNLHCTLRQRVLPLFDLEKCLVQSLAQRRLLLAIPWIVEYLSLVDRGSLLLPHFHAVWGLLQTLRGRLASALSMPGRLLIQLCLGWLFQIVSPPDVPALPLPDSQVDSCLDDLCVVTEKVLYYVCPYLSELNAVLAGNSVNQARHIRPTPTTPREDVSLAAKQLQLKLEESFLQNQTQSTRRSIQFVAERVTSSCIKDLLAEILPNLKITDSQHKDRELMRESLVSVGKIAQPRVEQSLRALLGRDVAKGAVEAAISLALRQVLDKVHSWMQSHLLPEPTDQKQLKEASVNPDNSIIEEKTSKENEVSPHLAPMSVCIEKVREATNTALAGQLTEESLMEAVKQMQVIANGRNIPLCSERGLLCLACDLLVTSYLACPHLSEETFTALARCLTDLGLDRHPSNPTERLFCPRNKYLAELNNTQDRFAQFPHFLVKLGIMELSDVISQMNLEEQRP